MIEDVLTGSDVEFFVQDKETNEIVSAEGLIKGTKSEPYKFDEVDHYFATSLDNVLYEGNIPPSKTKEDFIKNLNHLRSYMDRSLPSSLKTLAMGSARLDWKYLETDNARTYGCALSNNAWTETIETPGTIGDEPLRGAGFHLHIGYKNPSYSSNIAIIKLCDLYLATPAVLLEPASERKFAGYGKAGNHRHCDYGVEYRTLSSYFASSDKLIGWCYDQLHTAIKHYNEKGIDEVNHYGEMIQNAINFDDIELAKELVDHFKITLP